MLEQWVTLPPWAEALAATEFHGISLRTAAAAFTVLFLALLFRRVISNVIAKGLLKLAARTRYEWDDEIVAALQSPMEAVVVIWGIWMASRVLLLPLEMEELVAQLSTARTVLVLLVVAWAAFRLVAVGERALRKRANQPDNLFEVGLVPVVVAALRIFVVLIFSTVIASSLGYSVTGLAASLGLGGAALALASRDAIANLFGFFMILLDRPFRVGDWIKGSGFEGVVEEIGFRSTRIRTFGKTVENIPNNLMANAYVENMDRRRDAGLNVRRISMTVGVTYATTPDQMETVIGELRKMLDEDPGVSSAMTKLVYFTEFGASSLDIFFYYFSNRADWAYYLEVRQRVNLQIMRILAKHGLEVAFPSQSVYLESLPDGLDLPKDGKG